MVWDDVLFDAEWDPRVDWSTLWMDWLLEEIDEMRSLAILAWSVGYTFKGEVSICQSSLALAICWRWASFMRLKMVHLFSTCGRWHRLHRGGKCSLPALCLQPCLLQGIIDWADSWLFASLVRRLVKPHILGSAMDIFYVHFKRNINIYIIKTWFSSYFQLRYVLFGIRNIYSFVPYIVCIYFVVHF